MSYNEYKQDLLNRFKEYRRLHFHDRDELFEGSAIRIKTPVAGLPLGVAVGKIRGAIDNDKPFDS